MQVTTFERGTRALEEAEGLEASQEVANLWKVSAVRICIALAFLQGASKGEGRQQWLHLFGVEMDDLGLPLDRIKSLLREWNTRVFPPLPVSEIQKVIRRLERPGKWPYSCKHPKLAAYCIGEACPHRSTKGLWRLSNVSANGLTQSGWLPLLNGSEVRVWLGLYRLARLKGRGPNARIPFCFRELERHSGVKRGHLREVLLRLKDSGLISEVVFSEKKGDPSFFRFPPRLPAPNNKETWEVV